MASKYQQAVKAFMQDITAFFGRDKKLQTQLIMDTERDHYQMVRLGWQGEHRLYNCSIHLDIIDDQIWIQCNNTEILIDEELERFGVPKSDVIIGFLPPTMRELNKQVA